ncbi:MAG: molybdate ABC transporter substrate-binding protein [Armatimonadota bacterium]
MSNKGRYLIIIGAAVVAAVVILLSGRRKPRPAGQTEVSVYVPCGLIMPMSEAIKAYNDAHPNVRVNAKYDNAVVLMRLIRDKGHRPDLFVSPGEQELAQLESRGLIDPASKRQFGEFELAIIIPKRNPAKIRSLEGLSKARIIAFPDPSENSVGFYARQSLQRLGLWGALVGKFQYTEHPIQAHTFVASAKADAGLAYKHCPLDTAPEKLSKSKVAVLCDLPKDTYDTPKCIIAMLNESKHKREALAFADYLVQPQTLSLLASNGLPSPGGEVSAAAVYVQAFYPDNEGHRGIKDLVLGLQKKYPGKVRAEFVDFTTPDGLKRRTDAGLTCGGIIINGQNTVRIGQGESAREVTFMMGMGGEWTAEELEQAVAEAVERADAEAAHRQDAQASGKESKTG